MKKQTILLLALIINSTIAYAQTTYTPQSLILNIYADGSTRIEYIIETIPTKPRTNITLFGELYQNLIITEENGLPLTWKTNQIGIQTDTLGSKTVSIEYETYDLVNKTANQWTLTVTTPINTIITLPENAILTRLDPTPLSIATDQDQVTLTQPNGTTTVSYILGTIGTKERAIILLNKAKTTITQAKQTGIKVTEVETLLIQAQEAYDESDYLRSEQTSTSAINLTEEIVEKANDAQSAIESASSLLAQSSENLASESLTQANEKLDLANTAYSEGNYDEAILSAEEVSQIIVTGSKETGNLIPIMLIGGTLVILVVVLALSRVIKTGNNERIPVTEPVSENEKIDIDALFRENQHLRTDEKAVLRYIHESDGAFVSDIRERFDIPKSSTWRMIKRLEDYELIYVEQVGRESHVNIKKQ